MLNLMLMFNAEIFKNRLSSKIILSISKSNKIKKGNNLNNTKLVDSIL